MISLVAQLVKNPFAMQETQVWSQETQFWSFSWENPQEKEISTHLPRKPYVQRSLVVYSPWGLQESEMTEHLNI